MSHSPWVALEATTDKRRHARKLAKAHRRVLGGAGTDRSIRDVIRESWRRSAAAGVDPSIDSAPVRLSDEQSVAALESGPLALAPPILRRLREDVQGDDQQMALLCDPHGTILWIDGDPRVLDEARTIHLSRGAVWSEEAVGTNAMGTALAVDHPVQIFSAEHFAEHVHEWTCAAAPLHDPDTGEKIGVIDLSGGLPTAHPHSLALVASAARMIETLAARERRFHEDRLRDRFATEVGPGRAHALVSPQGRIVVAASGEWEGERLDLPDGGGPMNWSGASYTAEPVDDHNGYLLVRRPRAHRGTVTHVEALGRDRARVTFGGRSISLSRRHSEILFALSLRPGGMSAEELALAVWGESAKPVSARAELCRLRRSLGPRLRTTPYRLGGEIRGDYDEVRELVSGDHLDDALLAYPGPLLPRSDVPVVAEARQTLEDELRGAIMARRDPGLLERWLTHPCGADDTIACRTLLSLLPDGDSRRPAALSHLRRMTATHGSS